LFDDEYDLLPTPPMTASCVDGMAEVLVTVHDNHINHQATLTGETCGQLALSGSCSYKFILPCEPKLLCNPPTAAPTLQPTAKPTPEPTAKPTPEPTAAPTPIPTTILPVPTNNVVVEEEKECSTEYIYRDNGNSVCPNSKSSVVTLQGSVGYDSSGYEDGNGIIYDIRMNRESNTVTFRVNNIFLEDADVYVKHEVFSPVVNWFREPDCELVKSQVPCIDEADDNVPVIENTFTAACRDRGYAIVYLYFATKDSEVLFFDDVTPTIPECCYPEDYDYSTTGIVEFAYKIGCECPPDDSGTVVDVVVDAVDDHTDRRNLHHRRGGTHRNLRRSPKDRRPPRTHQRDSVIFDNFHRRLRGDVGSS
jgi:hypothetical protein